MFDDCEVIFADGKNMYDDIIYNTQFFILCFYKMQLPSSCPSSPPFPPPPHHASARPTNPHCSQLFMEQVHKRERGETVSKCPNANGSTYNVASKSKTYTLTTQALFSQQCGSSERRIRKLHVNNFTRAVQMRRRLPPSSLNRWCAVPLPYHEITRPRCTVHQDISTS
jgi:hypothetical protein